jgi:hypothetical protein
MNKKISALVGAAAYTGPIVIFVHEVVREIAADVVPLPKFNQGSTAAARLSARPTQPARRNPGHMDITGARLTGENNCEEGSGTPSSSSLRTDNGAS